MCQENLFFEICETRWLRSLSLTYMCIDSMTLQIFDDWHLNHQIYEDGPTQN